MTELTVSDLEREITAYVSHFVTFKAEKRKIYAPPENTVYNKLHRSGKLTRQQCHALNLFYNDVFHSRGNSNGLVGSYAERLDRSGNKTDFSYSICAPAQRLIELSNRLHKHEKAFLYVLYYEYHRNRNHEEIDLESLGKKLTGYKSKTTATAAIVSRLQGLADTISEFYNTK